MSIVLRKSDISGAEGSPEAFTHVVIWVHPVIGEAREIDVLSLEWGSVARLAPQLVTIEVTDFRKPDRSVVQQINYPDFQRVVPDEVVRNASVLSRVRQADSPFRR